MGSTESSHGAENTLRYGFIGLGVMGWGMANNLRARLSESSSLCVCEISKARLDQWLAQAPGPVSVATTPKEVAEHSVSHQTRARLPVLISLG